MTAYARRRFLNLSICCFGLMLSCVHLSAYALTEGDYTYTVADGTATITGFNTSYSGALAITHSLGGYPVIRIGDYAFYWHLGLTSVTIPDSVTSIGDYAFYRCIDLASITIPDSVISIGESAFNTCNDLASITIPDSVTSIGQSAFFDCRYLTNAVIGTGVINIGGGAFMGCGRLPNVTFPDSVVSIGYGAFSSCYNLTNVMIGNGVTNIGIEAFASCWRLASVTFPESVVSIGDTAFAHCDVLTGLYFKGKAPNLGVYVFSQADANATVYYVFGTAGWGAFFGELPTAVWTSTATFDAGDGTAEFASRAYNVDNAYGQLPTASRPGYDFDGWWTGAGGTGSRVTEDTRVTVVTNHTVYAKWMVKINQPPLIMRRAPLADPAAVSEGASVAFSVTAGDSSDPDAEARGMSNITWYVDGVWKRVTKTGAPGTITSAFTWKTDTSTVQGEAFRAVQVKAVALDKQGGITETVWTVGVNNLPSAQTITFPILPVKALGAPDFAPGATVKSGLQVQYSSANESVARIVDGLVRVVGTGTSVITASQPGTFDFKAATPVKQTLTVKARLLAEVSSGAGTVAGAGLYLPGTRVALTARPALNNTFLRWEDGSQATSRSLTMPNANLTVSAWFGLTTNVPKPAIADPGPQQAMVGVFFKLPLNIQSDSLPGVTVTGLPAGLSYNAAAKAVAGVPTVAVTNKVVTITARNGNRTPATNTFALTVNPLPVWAKGNFNGWFGSGASNIGPLSADVTAQGKVTGKLMYLGTNYAFSAASYARRDNDGVFWLTVTARVTQVTQPMMPAAMMAQMGLPLTFAVQNPADIDPPSLSVVDGWLAGIAEGDPIATLYRNVWKDAGMTAVATNYAGYYTATLPGRAEYGSGYLTFTVDRGGGVKTVGKLADGMAISLSGPLVLDEAGHVFAVLYAAPIEYKGGSLFGLVEFSKASEGARVTVCPLDDSSFVWTSLNTQAADDYGAGFQRTLWLTGGWYDTVGNLYSYYAGRELSIGTDAGALTPALWVGTNLYSSTWWNPGGIALTVVTNRLGVMIGLTAPAASMPVKIGSAYDYESGTNAVGLGISLIRATGVFRGAFKAWFDYPMTHTSKSVAFEGVLTPERDDREDGVEGRGFFLWEDKGQNRNVQGRSLPYRFNGSYDLLLLSRP